MTRVSMICAALLATAAPALAQPAAEEQPVYERDPATMSALSRLGAALRAQPNAEVHVAVTTEDVLMSGQKVQFGGFVDMLVSRPNKMKVQLKVGQSERQIYYDGKNVTLYAPQQNFYAVFAAPPTIRKRWSLRPRSMVSRYRSPTWRPGGRTRNSNRGSFRPSRWARRRSEAMSVTTT